jgi:hypothetical protein
MVDLSVYGKLQGFADYQRANEEFQLKKQLLQAQAARNMSSGGGSTPAALQLANEYQDALDRGDVDRAGYIAQFAKIYDRGVTPNAAGGVGTVQGYADAAGAIEGAKAGYKQQAEKNVDFTMNPQIQLGTERAKIQAAFEQDQEKKGKQAVNMTESINQAEALLPKASAGAIDRAERFLYGQAGKSTDKSKVDRQLQVLSATLVSNVPRMEGPQSNYDVELYKQAAADIANPAVPREDRLAAVKTLKDLQTKYLPANQSNDEIIQDIFNPEGYAPAAPVELKRPQLSKGDAINELRRRGKL